MNHVKTISAQAGTDAELINVLRLANVLSDEALERAVTAAERSSTRLEKSLIELGLIEEESLISILADWLKIPLIEADGVDRTLTANTRLSRDYLLRAELVPVGRQDGVLVVATANPRDREALRSIAFHLNEDILTAVATTATIRDEIQRLYEGSKPVAGTAEAADSDVERLQALANDGPVIKLVSDILAQAVDQGASDIHLEAIEARAQIRLRFDGVLHHMRYLNDADRRAATSRLKVMANLNIAEHRRPQDGRARITVRGRNIDLRLSTLPTQFGESIVIRILDQTRLKLDWNALGFAAPRVVQLERMIRQPNGIFLVAGPTGSGKTTTLYTALSRINEPERKIVTVEDPIEYALPGINQVQVRPEIDMTFATALRAILRQDPDVVMIGEIRDPETAENAVRAALMGRLVLSTVHTNSSLAAIDRLKDLGIPSYLLAETLRGVLSQRLVRTYCSTCAGKGCTDCSNTGMRGRMIVSELLEISTETSTRIASGSSAAELMPFIEAQGFISMAAETSHCIKSGVIPATEAHKVFSR